MPAGLVVRAGAMHGAVVLGHMEVEENYVLAVAQDYLAPLQDAGVDVPRQVAVTKLAAILRIAAALEHAMHAEWYSVPPETAQAIRACSGRVVAVGTTTVRCLESAAREVPPVAKRDEHAESNESEPGDPDSDADHAVSL